MGTELEKIISEVLQQGLSIPEQTLFFAESTYGLSPEMLVPAWFDESFEGTDALNELILTPEPDLRVTVEPALSVQGLSAEEIDELTTALSFEISSIDLIIPGTGKPWPVTVHRDMIALFLDKLYLGRSLDGSVIDSLVQTFSPSVVLDARVLLRGSGASFGEIKRTFLYRFISRSRAYESSFTELLQLVVAVLAEFGDEQPVEPYLQQKKRMLINTLKEIRHFGEKRDHYSMEYLMMQRFKVPHESEDEVLSRLYLLTTVTDVILGLPPDQVTHVAETDFGRFDATTDLGKLIRTLS